MTWDQVGVLAAVVAALVAIAALVMSVIKQAREQAQRDMQEKQEIYNRGVVDGKVSRDDEVRQLTFERDDAKADLARARRRADEFEQRYSDLRERKGP